MLVFLFFFVFVLICLDLKLSFHLSWLVHILLNSFCQLGWFCAYATNIMVSLSLSIIGSLYHIISTFFNYFCFLSIPSTMTKNILFVLVNGAWWPKINIRGHPTFDHFTKKCAFYKDGIKGGFDVYMNDINNISKCTYTCWHQHQTPTGCIF